MRAESPNGVRAKLLNRARMVWAPGRKVAAGSLGAVGLLLLASAAGCSAGRGIAGSPADRCASVLPVAATAVHEKGSFSGVVLASPNSVRDPRERTLSSILDSRAGTKVSSACVVLYTGRYTVSDVSRPLVLRRSPDPAPYAIVFVNPADDQLLATIVAGTLPLRFRHEFHGFG